MIEAINPYSGEQIGEVPEGGAPEVDQAVKRAGAAARDAGRRTLRERAASLNAIATALRADAEPMAALLTSETGKTIREARAEVERAAGIFDRCAEAARGLHGETIPFDGGAGGEGRWGYWTRQPVGVIGAITPWNVPLALTAHKVGPALAGGNVVVHKPAEQASLTAVRLGKIIADALPAGSYELVTGAADAGAALVAHPDVQMITFTGSREVGMQIPARAGYKKVALELGGNCPVIVGSSANLDAAAAAIVRGAFAVAGQLCISVQRVIAHESIFDHLAEMIAEGARRLRVEDPLSEACDVGCLISTAARTRIESEVEKLRRHGARLLSGGEPVGLASIRPAVIDRVPPGAALLSEEAFAPLVLLLPYTELPDAIAKANGTPFGLNAAIFTDTLREARRAVIELDAGTVVINDVPTYRSDIMPYGGTRQSGLGREGVRFALEEMTAPKVVCFRDLNMNPIG